MLGFQDGVDLSERGDWKPLFLLLHLQPFKSDDFIRLLVLGSVHHPICAFFYTVQTLEFLHTTAALETKTQQSGECYDNGEYLGYKIPLGPSFLLNKA